MITQADFTTGAYFFLLAGGIIVTVGGIVIYLNKKFKYQKKK